MRRAALVLAVLLVALPMASAQPLAADIDKVQWFWTQKEFVQFCRGKDGNPNYADKGILFVDDELSASRIGSIQLDLQNYVERYVKVDFDQYAGNSYLVVQYSSYDFDWADKYAGIPLLVHIVTEGGKTVRVPAFMGMPEFNRAGQWASGWRVGEGQLVVHLPVDPSRIAALIVYPDDREGVINANDCVAFWQLMTGFAPEGAIINPNVSVTVNPQVRVEQHEQPAQEPMAGQLGSFDTKTVAAAGLGGLALGVVMMQIAARRM